MELGLGAGAFILVAWIVKHVTTRTLPELTKRFEAALTKQLEVFERVNKEQRVEFREILENDRKLHYEREAELRKEFRIAIDKFQSTQETICEQISPAG